MLSKTSLSSCSATPRDRQNQRRIILWGFVWIATWLGLNMAISRDLVLGWVSVTLTVLSVLLGFGMIFAYRRFLREADELRRKIELDALALAFGVGVVGGMTYWMMARAGLVDEADILYLVMLMLFTQSAGVAIGWRRYS